VYQGTRERFLALVAEVPPSLQIPATPEWDVRMLVAHLVGLNQDLVDGNVADYAGAAWTDAQVASRAEVPLQDLLAEWDVVLPAFLEVLADPVAHGLEEYLELSPVVDPVSHDLDLREAAGREVVVDPEVWALIGPRRQLFLDLQVQGAGLPALRVVTPEGDDWIVGAGEPAGQVRAHRLEMWRSLEGRRTQDAVRSFEWTVDPGPYLPVWPASAFDWPT
jgi:uncharacterized protein (TIGR03083 family)